MRLKISAAALLAASAHAFAADLPARTEPPPPPLAPAASYRAPGLAQAHGAWNGFYVGGSASWNLGARDARLEGPTGGSLTGVTTLTEGKSPDGVGLGLYAGYNMRFGQYLTGVEADAQGLLDPEGRGSAGVFTPASPATGSFNLTSSEKRVGDAALRLRMGYLITPDLLVYAAGGLAATQYKRSWEMGGAIVVPVQNGSTTHTLADVAGGSDKIKFGWTIGAGLDYMILPDWTLRAEYRFASFGERKEGLASSCAINCGAPSAQIRYSDAFHSVRLGVAYHFGGRASSTVSARY